MDKIIWNNSYSVGVQELDEQHKKIVNALKTAKKAAKYLYINTGFKFVSIKKLDKNKWKPGSRSAL